MTRLLCTTLLCVLGTAQASAQTLVSQHCWNSKTMNEREPSHSMLQDSHRRCDDVIRTQFKGTVLGLDEWEAMCRADIRLVYYPCGLRMRR